MYPKVFFLLWERRANETLRKQKPQRQCCIAQKRTKHCNILCQKHFFCIFFPTPPPAHPRVRACTAYPLISFDSQLGCYANPKIEVLKTLSTLRAQILMDSEYIGSATTYCDKKTVRLHTELLKIEKSAINMMYIPSIQRLILIKKI